MPGIKPQYNYCHTNNAIISDTSSNGWTSVRDHQYARSLTVVAQWHNAIILTGIVLSLKALSRLTFLNDTFGQRDSKGNYTVNALPKQYNNTVFVL